MENFLRSRPAWAGPRRLPCTRNASAADEAGAGKDRAGGEEERSKGQQQIADSLGHLDKKKSAGIETVTHIRVAADWREAQRRVAEPFGNLRSGCLCNTSCVYDRG